MASYDYIFCMVRSFHSPVSIVRAYSRQLNGEIGITDKSILISAIAKVSDSPSILDALKVIVEKTSDQQIKAAAQKKLDEFDEANARRLRAADEILTRLRPLLEGPLSVASSQSVFDDDLFPFETYEGTKLTKIIEEINAVDPKDSKKIHFLLDRIVLNFTEDLPDSLIDAANRKIAQCDPVLVMRTANPIVTEFLDVLHRTVSDDLFSEELSGAPRVIERCSVLFVSLYNSSDRLRAAIENIRDNHPDSKIRESFEKLFPKTETLPD